jgi:hypothetical protein
MYEAFTAYAVALEDAVTDKLPEVLQRAVLLPQQGQDAQAQAQPEFDALGVMAKAKAGVAAAKNLALVPKIPAFVKAAAE